MNNQEILSALAGLGQRLYDKAIEARGMREAMKQHGRHHEAKLYDTKIVALVEFGNEVDRIITQAQKASLEQPSPAVPCSAWVEELEAARRLAKEADEHLSSGDMMRGLMSLRFVRAFLDRLSETEPRRSSTG